MKYLFPILVLSLFALTILPSSAAADEPWKDGIEKTFVFEISNKEAEKLLKSSPHDSLITRMLHTQVGEFSGNWEEMPRQGHFIYADIRGNSVGYRYVPVMPFKVFLYKEYGILTLQVVDEDGEVREDAKVRIAGRWKLFNKRVQFDSESNTYRIDDWSEKRHRMLTVELDGMRVIFDLTKHIVNPYYSWGGGGFYSPDFYSYMITDKNKYKPGETVRFKSYALTGSRRALRKDLEVWIETDNWKFKKVGDLSPYNPGGYTGGVLLHDSLELRLDRQYHIHLRERRGRIVGSTRFMYEDYVLYDNSLEATLSDRVHYYPDQNIYTIKVTDANGLLVQDVTAEVKVTMRNIQESFVEVLTVPHVLMDQSISLDNDAPTEVVIPADIMGNANGDYEVSVRVLTPDGQVMTSSSTASYKRHSLDIEVSTHGDTVRFDFMDTGKPVPVVAELTRLPKGETRTVGLPYEEVFEQGVGSYHFEVPGRNFKKRIPGNSIPSRLYLDGGIEQDSFKVRLLNPLNLDVSWYIYRRNILLEKGAGREMEFSFHDMEHTDTYYAEVFYFMGGTEQAYRRSFEPEKQNLTVTTDLPDRIYPGQTVEATVNVRDNLGYPVKNVDLTAFAFNNLLDYHVPDMSYYGDSPNVREQRSSYDIDSKGYSFRSPLDYWFWRERAGLDQSLYYRFAYPKNRIFTTTMETPDGTTQVAPFVMRNGEALQVHAVEINNTPVWFSWVENPQEYSFLVNPDVLNTIYVRLADRVLIFRDRMFPAGLKTVMSVDIDNLPDNVREVKPGHWGLTNEESNRYSSLIALMPVRRRDFAEWYHQNGDSTLVYHPLLMANNSNTITAGPLFPGQAHYGNSVEYRHEGRYSYAFEGNVVYKTPTTVMPNSLGYNNTESPLRRLNDFHLTPKRIEQRVEHIRWRNRYWAPAAIQIAQDNLNLKFSLPVEKDSTGVANLIFIQYDSTGTIIYPDTYRNGVRHYSDIKPGVHDAVLLYNNGKYIRFDSLQFVPHTYMEVDMRSRPLHEADSVSLVWRDKYSLTLEKGDGMVPGNDFRGYDPGGTRTYTLYQPGPSWNSVCGYVYDEEEGEPLIGATVVLKGTTTGTVTNMDGYFELAIPPGHYEIAVYYIGYTSKEMTVSAGSLVHILMGADYQMIDGVVVVGYGTQMKRSLTGSVRGISSADGSSPPSTLPDEDFEDDEPLTPDREAEDRLYRELISLSGIRSNFSDVGFWEPSLVTDKKGNASFEVTFPDNITKWEAVVYAMNRRLQTGTYRKSIRSYKPLMAELRMPGFLVEGDSSVFSGNLRNFTTEQTVSGTSTFANNGDTLRSEVVEFSSSRPEYMTFVASATDSLTANYSFSREDGYTDGEERTIAIEPLGTEVAFGDFGFVRGGEPVTVTAADGETVELMVTAKQLDIYLNTASYLTGYRYACNEQLASKLIGLLTTRLYMEYDGKRFGYDRQVNDIIRRLLSNRNDQQLWSWFGRTTDSSFWMSAHILRALKMARDHGYRVDLNMGTITNSYIDVKALRSPRMDDIQVLHALAEWGAAEEYEPAVEYWEGRIAREEFVRDSTIKAEKLYYGHERSYRRSYLSEKLMLWDIRRMQGLEYSPDSIAAYLRTDMFGGVYCDDKLERSWYSNELMTTLLAYNIVRADSALMHYKEPMQMYVIGTRSGWNTYYGASAVYSVFPDLLAANYSSSAPAVMQVAGSRNETVTEYPYKIMLDPGESVTLQRQEGIPLLYSAHTRRLVTEERVGEGFEIQTTITGDGRMAIGRQETLIVKVKAKQKNAEYVMIEVPIPAGCDYASKPSRGGYPEVHREHLKEKAVIFCRSMPEGEYTFRIDLLPRFAGTYSLNPAKVELMYFPVVSSNNDLRRITLER